MQTKQAAQRDSYKLNARPSCAWKWLENVKLKADGTNSHNLFGIKATGGWDGKVVETMTTEYINGIKQKRIEKFRAYEPTTLIHLDFAKLIRQNPRYENVMANMHNPQAYAKAMQQAGYATDPQYASKLANVIMKVSSWSHNKK